MLEAAMANGGDHLPDRSADYPFPLFGHDWVNLRGKLNGETGYSTTLHATSHCFAVLICPPC